MAHVANWFKNRYFRAYAAAAALHFLFFFFGDQVQRALMIVQKTQPEAQVSPLIFEFVDVQDEASRTAPESTPLLSHQDQRSQDQRDDATLPESHMPFTDGVVFSKEMLQNQVKTQDFDARQAQQAKPQMDVLDKGFDFSEVLRQDPKQAQIAQEQAVFGPSGAPGEQVATQSQTRALDRGGLQLSTYAWNYAPYMAYLKRQIDNHIFPPRAFDLGLIDGTTRVKFRIYPDGRLEGPELLGFKGSAMLKDTSLKAVELSAPFRALPKDFPDDYLEIVGTFEYIVLRYSQ